MTRIGNRPVARSVERNALLAKLVIGAEGWQWSSLWRRSSYAGVENNEGISDDIYAVAQRETEKIARE